MKAKSLLPTLLLALMAGATADAQQVIGYGPWRFGMSKAEVEEVKEFGPYTPVASTKGLETKKGPFVGEDRNVSFVFGPGGLSHIQVWVYEGRSYEEAVRQFYRAYQHLTDNFGPVHQDGSPWPADLTPETFAARIPSEYRLSSTPESFMADLESSGSAKLEVSKLHLHPQRPIQNAEVYASLVHSPKMGSYWVFLYYKMPPPRMGEVSAG
jgi:hypothetical protein